MLTVILVIHILLAVALVGVILLQRSEGGGLGMGGGSGGGGMGGFLSGRGTASLLTRTTAGLAAAFMVTSLVLAIMSGGSTDSGPSLLDQPAPAADAAPAVPPVPSEPSVPLAR
jgi:preprotein translocase subunit SecG